MRRLTTFSDAPGARSFAEVLAGEGIEHRLEIAEDQPGAEVWILRDDRLGEAKALLEGFRADPTAERFRQARARSRQREHEEKALAADQRAQQERWDRAQRPIRPGPVTIGVIVVSALLTLLGIGSIENLGSALFTLPYGDIVDYLYIDDVAVFPDGDGLTVPFLWNVRNGEVWRLFTPAFVHSGGLFHLGFNAYWFFLLGQQIETRKGWAYLLVLVLVTGVVSTLAQYVVGWVQIDTDLLMQGIRPDFGLFGRIYLGGPVGGGLSGVLYGLFGYILAKSYVDKFSGLGVPSSTVALLLIWLVVCFGGTPVVDPETGATYTSGVAGNIANMAHLGGLLCGAFWGLVSHRIRPTW